VSARSTGGGRQSTVIPFCAEAISTVYVGEKGEAGEERKKVDLRKNEKKGPKVAADIVDTERGWV